MMECCGQHTRPPRSASLRFALSGVGTAFFVLCWIGLGWSGVMTESPAVAAAPDQIVAAIVADRLPEPAQFGMTSLRDAMAEHGWQWRTAHSLDENTAPLVILAGLAEASSPAARELSRYGRSVPSEPEAYSIWKTESDGRQVLVLCGADARGLMYAALEAAERVGWAADDEPVWTHVRAVDAKPDLLERSVSMYTMHRRYFEDRLFDEAYWQRYFSQMARNRLNSFVVIFGYENGGFMAPPYPYFFDVEGFPEVRLVGSTEDEQRRHVEALRKVIRIAHGHGVDFVAGIWDHIYRGGVQGGGIPGKNRVPDQPTPGLVWGLSAENLASYNKAALAKFLEVFPDIDGLQFRMHGESGLRRDEIPKFWHEIFSMLHEKRPTLRVDIRAKGLPDVVVEDGLRQGIPVRVATKYWMEQMGLPFHPTHINRPNQHDRRHGYADLLRYPQKYRVHWRLWNGGTTRVLLWGSPDYVRRFVESCHVYDGRSFEVNEPLATKMLAQPHDAEPFSLLNQPYRYYDWEFERYWHFYQLFGRLGYNPDESPEIWQREFVRRFGDPAGKSLMRGLHLASDVLPRIVAASYRYRYFPTTRGWPEKMRIDDLPTYATAEGTDIQQFLNFDEEASLVLDGGETAKRRPDETSRWFVERSRSILQRVAEAERAGGDQVSREFVSTVTDLKILAYLALYHGRRMPAAVHYQLFRKTGDLTELDAAIAAERRATEAWERLVQAAGDVYTSNLAMGIPHGGLAGHWRDELVLLREGLGELEQQLDEAEKRAGDGPPRLAHVPIRRQEPDQPMTVRATVLGTPLPESVQVRLASGGRAARRLPMTRTGVRRYAVEVPADMVQPPLQYAIEFVSSQATRTMFPDEPNGADGKVIVSADRTPPTAKLGEPMVVAPGEPIPVSVEVRDESRVKWVRLRYRHVTQFEDYETVEMKPDRSGNVYRAEIPGSFVVPEWDMMYFIEVMDRAGNGRMYPDLERQMPYVIVPLKREHTTPPAAHR